MALPELFANSPTPGSELPLTTLGAAVTTTNGTTITTAAAAPAALQAAGQFRVVIGSEIMIVTAGAATTTWTVTRGAEGSTAATHLIGVNVWHELTAGALGGQSDAAAGTPSLRSLGSSATQAAPGTGSAIYAPLSSASFTGQIGYTTSNNENCVNVQNNLASGYTSSLYFGHSGMASGTGYNLFWGENATGTMFVARGDGQLLARFASISVLSDKALKKNVADLRNSLEVVCALRPRSFDWRDESRGSDIGFIAQEAESHVPHLVDRHVKRRGGKEYKTFAQGGLVPYLVGAVKELAARVEGLEKQLQET